MFFSPELLSRRDSGFGLLWLAATLGAKSSFKKLPKRDVLGADISQLCTLITQPQEPLALRLSSNLMVGVARVYKVKQEIFLGDVTACFAALKKAVQDIRALSATGASLQMGQPTVRPDAVTLAADPAMALNLNFDNLLADWDQFLNEDEAESDDEYGVRKKAGKKKGKRPFASVEDARAALHTLDENLEQMLSGSFDASFLGGALGGAGASSSQVDEGINFGFDDNLFADGDEIDLSAFIGGDLGEDWGATPAQPGNDDAMIIDDPIQFEVGPAGMDLDVGDVGGFTFAGFDQPSATSSVTKNTLDSAGKKRPFEEFNREHTLSPVRPVQDVVQALAESPAPWNAEDAEEPGQTEEGIDVDQGQGGRRKPKRVRLLLDARTELTDEELKDARAQYVEGQDALRQEIEAKKLEKESGRLIEEMLWGVPKGLRAPILVDFWLENFKVQVEARSGALHLEMKGAPPMKRRRIEEPAVEDELPKDLDAVHDTVAGTIWDAGVELDLGHTEQQTYDDPVGWGSAQQRSSEEPGQARRVSRHPSPLGGGFDFGRALDVEVNSQSQKSSMFPWDNAGASSSVNGVPFEPGSDRVSIGRAEVKIRGSSAGRSRRESSLGASQLGSAMTGGIGFSPGDFGKAGSLLSGDNFEFDVPAEAPTQAVEESQLSDVNLVTLERNSFNFLEYAKMQTQTLAQPADGLCFDEVVPKNTSTPHVAAAAFYQCLVLATKNLIRVAQPEAYGPLKIHIT